MDNVLLDGGLDLVRARPAVLPGRIRACLNYEVGWERGYARIDGWERFDGHISPSATDYWVVILPTADVTGTPQDQPTDLVWTFEDEDGSSGTMVDYVESGGVTSLSIVFRQGRVRPRWGSVIADEAGTWSFVLEESSVTVYKLSDVHSRHEDFLGTLSTYTEILRGVVKPVPGGGTIVGLHYHEDQLHAIRDMLQIRVAEGDEGTLIPGMYVYNDAGQVGLVSTEANDDRYVNITAINQDGFTVEASEVFHIALTLRFNTGSGLFEFGDSVLGDTSAWAGTVGEIDRRDGSFDSGNALGVAAFINGPDTGPTIAEIFNNQTQTGAMTIESVMFLHQKDALAPESVSSKSDLATMWKSTDDGWEAATTGSVLSFVDGLVDPLDTANPTAVTITKFPNSVVQGTGTQGAWSTPLDDIKLKDGVTSSCNISGGYIPGLVGTSLYLKARDFKLGLLDNDVVKSVRAVFTCRDAGAAGASWKVRIITAPSNSGTSASCPVDPSLLDYTSGNIPWAPSSPQALNASDFGIHFVAKTYSSPCQPTLDAVALQVVVDRLPGAKLYLYDPTGTTDIGYISVESTVIQSGQWGGGIPVPGLAAGYFRLKDWSITSIPSGTEVWTEPGGTGLQICTLSGSVATPTLPGSRLLDENHSRYQMVSYNFFATEEQNAIYGVSGAGFAFWYDGETLDFIPTGVDAEDDKPRHIAPHENRLHLGYIWGEVYASGPDPLDFSASTGLAASYGFGDKITGLMPAAGKALAVFTESTTNVLIGAVQGFGEAALETVEQQVVNHKVGAIEYTVQNIGNRPIFASFRGIETLETMDQYSDFFTAPLTYDVSPWLLRRLQSAAGVETTDESVVNSVVVRNKNQYRLFFADGYVLTLTYVGPEKEPQNTIQQYWFNDAREQFARVYATASGVSTSGKDHAFFSTEERPHTPQAGISVVTPETDFVYELDRGRSFDGFAIESYIELTHYYGKSEQTGAPAPGKAKRFSVFHVHGKVAGYANMRVSRSVNYEAMDNPEQPYESIPFGSEEMKPEDATTEKYTKGRLTARGFAVSLRIAHKSAVEFPHVVQMITFLNDAELRDDR
ncbi:MAG: hypothetical protein DRH08_01365 [Deltaproteobacteria bacterium]|nr:MAG: hypothetical protein DRH08_01365 [Deltaproteobacteria bacterium]